MAKKVIGVGGSTKYPKPTHRDTDYEDVSTKRLKASRPSFKGTVDPTLNVKRPKGPKVDSNTYF